jgi:hypothetical protein
MLKVFWIVIALIAVIGYKNTRYAIKQYFANRNYTLFTVYMALLLGLAFLLVHVTTRVIDLAQSSADMLHTSQNL